MMAQRFDDQSEASALHRLAAPLLIAVDIDAEARQPSLDGLVTLIGFEGDQPVVAEPGSSEPLTLRTAPTTLVAVISSAERSPDVARLLSWMTASGMSRVPPVVPWRTGHETVAVTALLRELQATAARSKAQQIETAQQSARLGATNRELRYRFALAEGVLKRKGSAPFTIGFTNEPIVEQSPYDVLNDCADGISQILPLGSGGVAAIGVHLGATLGAGSAGLEIGLRSLEDQRLVASWVVSGPALKPGWTVLALPRTLSGLDRTLELRIKRSGHEEHGPVVSLGGGQPIETFQIRDLATGQPVLARSLALQIWRGLPGLQTDGLEAAHFPAQQSSRTRGGLVERPLTASLLKSIEHANADTVTFDFPAVWAPPGENAVTCHPPSHGLTLGCLARAVPADAMKVSASIAIADDKSHPVDFGIVIAADRGRASAILDGAVQAGAHEGFSGWTPLAKGERKRLSVFSEPVGDVRSVFIATRMSKPGDNSYAQARFTDFTVMAQG